MDLPLVSVMLPSYNAAASLPWAIASLQAQSYPRWECLLVDDGSTDATASVIASLSDPRIRSVRVWPNRGRAAARQTALDLARGEYLTTLDADDWLYPNKLQQQVGILSRRPELAAVGTGMMVFDADGRPHGVQGQASGDGTLQTFQLDHLGGLPIANAPIMLRMTLAKRTRYDLELDRGQDFDFVLRTLWRQPCGLICEPLYAYRELDTMTYAKVSRGLANRLKVFRKFTASHPWACFRAQAATHVRRCVYWLAFRGGRFEWLIARRSHKPTARQIEEYLAAQQQVHVQWRTIDMRVRDSIVGAMPLLAKNSSRPTMS